MKLVVSLGERTEEVTIAQRAHGWSIRLGETTHEVDAAGNGALRSLIIDGRQHEVHIAPLADGRYHVATAGGMAEVTVKDPLAHLAEKAHGSQATGPRTVTAYMPGVVKKILVAAGDTVSRGQGLAVLEAMKMENEIEAESEGTIEKVLVKEGQPVDGGEALFEIG